MLNKDFFRTQLDRLVIEYADKGFLMTKERAAQWYNFMSHFNETKFQSLIDDCLRYTTYSPTMADILKNNEREYKNPYRKVD